jgi:hypothetical protein
VKYYPNNYCLSESIQKEGVVYKYDISLPLNCFYEIAGDMRYLFPIFLDNISFYLNNIGKELEIGEQ